MSNYFDSVLHSQMMDREISIRLRPVDRSLSSSYQSFLDYVNIHYNAGNKSELMSIFGVDLLNPHALNFESMSLIEVDNEPVGLIRYSDAGRYTIDTDANHLLGIYVDAAHRRQSLATIALNHYSIGSATLASEYQTKEIISFFKKLGFREQIDEVLVSNLIMTRKNIPVGYEEYGY